MIGDINAKRECSLVGVPILETTGFMDSSSLDDEMEVVDGFADFKGLAAAAAAAEDVVVGLAVLLVELAAAKLEHFL